MMDRLNDLKRGAFASHWYFLSLLIILAVGAQLLQVSRRGLFFPTHSWAPVAPSSAAALEIASAIVPNQYGHAETYAQTKPTFEENRGQAFKDVRFISRGSGYVLLLTTGGAMLGLEKKPKSVKFPLNRGYSNSVTWLQLRLAGSNATIDPIGLDLLPNKTNYFSGRDHTRWQIGLNNYGRVSYGRVYPGVDLVFHAQRGRLEHDFVLSPGVDANQIVWKMDGLSGSNATLSIDVHGDLVIKVRDGILRLPKPVAYEFSGTRQSPHPGHTVEVRYRLKSLDQFGFVVADHNPAKGLIIDPTLDYSTYLGGDQDDQSAAIAVDSSGATYIAGQTLSTNFPTTSGAFQTSCAKCPDSSDVFVTKLNASGSTLVYSTYIGGSASDIAAGIDVDSLGNAYVTGQTTSSDFPVTPGAYQTTCVGCSSSLSDAFALKLSSTGTLMYSTLLGGSGADEASAIRVDANGNAHIVGSTSSSDFPTAKPLPSPNNSLQGQQNAFVAEINTNGTSLLASTYLGGSSTDTGYGIAVDSTGTYVTGQTTSNNFPTVSAVQSTFGGISDAFVSKLTPAGSSLIYSTYLGGTQSDTASAIAVDSSGNAYVTGGTSSTDFPISAGAFQTTYAGGGSDAFVTKINATGSKILYSTYFGGSDLDGGDAIAVDSVGGAFVIGGTASSNLPLANPIQTGYAGNTDAFVMHLVPGGCAVTLSTYLGGHATDIGTGVALDSNGNAYLTGRTSSNDFPLGSSPFQASTGGGFDAFVSRVNDFTSSAACLSSSKLQFPAQAINSSSTAQVVTLMNGGNAALNISNITASGDFSQTNECGSSLAVGANCTISVTFSPASSGGRTGAITITDDAGGSPQSVALVGTGTDFNMTVAPPAATVSSGGSASYTLRLTPVSGFNSTVDLSCSGAPASGNCNLSSQSVNFAGGATAKVTVTVSTTSTSGWLHPLPGHGPTSVAAVLMVPFGLAFFLFVPAGPHKTVRRRTLAFCAVLFAGTIFWLSCGFKTNTVGNYAVSLTAKDGSLQHSVVVTLSVQ